MSIERSELSESFPNSLPPGRAWLVFGLVVILLAVLYGPTLAIIGAICWDDSSYSHGLVLPFVTIYLLRERWGAIHQAFAKSNVGGKVGLGSLLLLCGLTLYFFGRISGSEFACWVSLFPTLAGLFYLLFGQPVTSLILGPFLLLFMAKPLPDSLVPKLFAPLQMLAAQIAARVLEVFSVPVHQLGNVIEIPGMQLLVEEACSGMRSVMALLSVGFIVISVSTFRRIDQLLLLLFALLVAILLNTFRVVATGLLAYFYDPVAAKGFFHEFSGLVTFFLGLIVVYWSAARLARMRGAQFAPPPDKTKYGTPPLRIARSGLIAAALIFALTGAGYSAVRARVHAERLVDVPIDSLPYSFGEWRGTDANALDERSLGILQLDRSLRRTYVNAAGDIVDVYIGYWRHQDGEHQAAKHTPAICLPANGWSVYKQSRSTVAIDSPTPVPFNTLHATYRGEPSLFYYWFFSGDAHYTYEWEALVRLSLSKLLEGRSDGGIVELSVPLRGGSAESEQRAAEAMNRFVKEFYPLLHRLVRTEPVAKGPATASK